MVQDHSTAVDLLVRQPSLMGIRRDNIEFIIRELTWLRSRGEEESVCDLIVGFHQKYAVPVEVKHGGDQARYEKAKKQVLQGRKFIENRFNLSVPYGLLMVYSERGFEKPRMLFEDEEVQTRIHFNADHYAGNLL